MLRNYFKIAWRNLAKNKLYSLINIAGLSVGLAVGMLILLWVQDERRFDAFYKKTSDIYKLENRVGTGASIQIWQSTAAPIGMLGKAELPEIRDVARITGNDMYALFKYKDKVFNEDRVLFADPSLFSIFDFEVVKGNKESLFQDDHSIVMTEKSARKYFGTEDAIGKVIVADDKTNFQVSAVVKDLPLNSSINADMFLPMHLFAVEKYKEGDKGDFENDFNQYNYGTFLLLKPGVNLASLANKLRDIHLRHKADDTDILYLIQAMSRTHLYKSDGTNAGIESVRMFMLVAFVILVIACINYVNLSTARSMLRSKEVSLRKIVGAARFQLFFQFIVETAVLFTIAAILSIGLMYVLMPSFNQISGKQLDFDLGDSQIWMVIGLTILGSLIVSSIYPAVLLSSFEPLKALKGKVSASISDAVFRKALVVVQFSLSIILIAGTLVIAKQLHFIRSKQLGYDKEHVFTMRMRGMGEHYEAVKAELLRSPGVLEVTKGSDNLVEINGQTGNNEWDGKAVGETFMVYPMAIDKDFIPFFKMQMVAGKNFTGTIADSAYFIMNETAVKTLGFKDPVGQNFRLWGTKGKLIGVVKDFHFASMKQRIEPMVFYYQPNDCRILFVKTKGADAASAIGAAETQWKKYNAGFEFAYSFLDDSFNRLYKSEERTGTLFNIFAGIAILISCLGLFGLAAYTAQVRRREIGVRKVLGASIGGIVGLLTKDFLRLVFIAIALATPIAWYIMHAWLQDFAYKTDLGWMLFVISGGIALLIAIITISFQSMKASLANPVKSLRTE